MFTMRELLAENGLEGKEKDPSITKPMAMRLRKEGYVQGWAKKPGDHFTQRYWGKPDEFVKFPQIKDLSIPSSKPQ
jgi:hypothetical protein